MVLLTAYQGLEFALLLVGRVRRCARTGRRCRWPSLAPLVMVAIELGMPQIFPFYLAISQAFVPVVIQIADLTGPLGVTALMVALNGALFDAWRGCATRGVRVAGLRPGRRRGRWSSSISATARVRMHQVDAAAPPRPRSRSASCRPTSASSRSGIRPSSRGCWRRTSACRPSSPARAPSWSSGPSRRTRTRSPRRRSTHDFAAEDPRRVRARLRRRRCCSARSRARHPQPADKYPYNTALMMDAAGDVTGKYDKVFLMMFGEYIPFYDSIPWFTKLFPEASNFSRGSEPASFPLQRGRPRLPAGPADLLRGHPARVRAPRGASLIPTPSSTSPTTPGSAAPPSLTSTWRWPCSARSSTASRWCAPSTPACPRTSTPPAASCAQTESVDPGGDCPPRHPKTLLVDLAMLAGGGLYRHVGDLFGLACLAALVVFLVRSRRRATADLIPGRESAPSSLMKCEYSHLQSGWV